MRNCSSNPAPDGGRHKIIWYLLIGLPSASVDRLALRPRGWLALAPLEWLALCPFGWIDLGSFDWLALGPLLWFTDEKEEARLGE